MGRPSLTVVVAAACLASATWGYEGQRANSILLNGQWEYAVGRGDEGAETPTGQAALQWKPVTLPGPFMPWSQDAANNIRFVWARRSFTVSPAQANSMAVLRWNRIALGAAAYINGVKVGENAPTGPYQVVLPEGLLKPGTNAIVLKVAGTAGAPKAKSGYLLIPAGFGDMPNVSDDVWIDFADGVYAKWVLAMPDLAASRTRFRVTLIARQPQDGLTVNVSVRPWPSGDVVGTGSAPATAAPADNPLTAKHCLVDVPMPGYKPWTYEEPNLYTARVKVARGRKTLDAVEFRFGMREIGVVDGHYQLNGKPLRFRGSELVFEWNWGDIIKGKERDYLVTEAREMSMNAFRTHTQPPPRLWADVCDEGGTMLLVEFPCLYNYQDYRFTPDEYAIWHRNVLSDAAGWMARLWNHPSVVMWVLSNESNRDSAWEMGPYHDFVRALDPTRPTMRTGDTGTAENFDVHTCGNVTNPVEGELIAAIPSWFQQAKGRPLTNSEYMNIFDRPVTQWTGTEDKAADALARAQLGAEHTEAMRRARLDGMLPYMYAGWTRTRTGRVWKGGFAHPESAAWHSSLSPVIASLDLFDPDYLTGQEVTTNLYLINDSWHDAKIHVDILLTKECPELLPEAPCLDAPLAKWSLDAELKADTVTKTPIKWRLPDQEGSYWLTARTTGLPGRPVLSQRFVRAIGPAQPSEALKSRTVVLLGGTEHTASCLRALGLTVGGSVASPRPDRDVVLVWDSERLTIQERQAADALCSFASAGGRVVVLGGGKWQWPELCRIGFGQERASRAFPYEGVSHPALVGIGRDWMVRWNGLPGTVAVGTIEGPALAGATKLLWAREPRLTVAAEVPAASGAGKVLVCQLAIRDHVDRSQPGYDPVAERMLLNLLENKGDLHLPREEQ